MFGEFGASVTSADRRAVQDQLEELVWSANSADADTDRRHWASLQAAEPALDAPTAELHRE
ncbi:MAG TPA: hypothetical protein VNS88_17010 [Nitrospiraceae bacterium]|nr:hypothetical protein [Nitrospiraceae bacterium]